MYLTVFSATSKHRKQGLKLDEFLITRSSKLTHPVQKCELYATLVLILQLINQSDPLNREDVGPLRVKFEISGQALSGMKIKTVKILNQDQTTPQKWLRYITVSDSFLVKLV